MKSQASLRPGDDYEEVYVDPVFNRGNRHLEKRFDVLKDAIDLEDSDALKEFIELKLPGGAEQELSQELVLQYRPDEWDSRGVIQKVQDIAKAHISSVFALSGQLEPRKFYLLRTENVQTYKQEYGLYNDNNETLYSAIVTVSSPTEYYSGETLYLVNGEGFRPNRTDIVIHRHEKINDWEIVEVLIGSRLDLVVVFQEIDRRISYDYPIDQDTPIVDGF